MAAAEKALAGCPSPRPPFPPAPSEFTTHGQTFRAKRSDKATASVRFFLFELTTSFTNKYKCVWAHTRFIYSVRSQELRRTQFVTHSLVALLILKGRNRV